MKFPRNFKVSDLLVYMFQILGLILVSPILLFMGILFGFEKLSKKFLKSKDLIIEDPDFGEMLFLPEDERPYWECNAVNFRIENKTMTIILNGSESGATKKQRTFYKDIKDNFDDYFDSIWLPFLQKEIGLNFISFTKDWKNEFSLESLEIPKFRGKSFTWEITFIAKSDTHFFTIEMRNWKPENLRIDG